MKNAHERFGVVEFRKQLKDTSTRLCLSADRFIGEHPSPGEPVTAAHLLSAIGSDVEIAALTAAITSTEVLTLERPDSACLRFTLGEQALIFRGTITIPGRKRPVRHLLAVSQALAAETSERLILQNDASEFLRERVARIHGLPLLPEWADWFKNKLEKARRLQPLVGLNCHPVAVSGTKQEFLTWIGGAVKQRTIRIPR